ncbi:RNA-binding protein [Canna indica]|uniref:YTH domain-containing family protein n=1 Tax=Canna indica TaxID=4628 RepID=A0AAQ3KLB7_9LILI|nr:RNA-binding protein [Canna indica]
MEDGGCPWMASISQEIEGNGFFGYVNENMDGLGELNKGPRSGHFRNQKVFGLTITPAVRRQSLPINVNTSGQFVGVAEMVGLVDFNKTFDYWQPDKWIGCFSVKWHIAMDVPNSILKHIILQNNDNEPVTNS